MPKKQSTFVLAKSEAKLLTTPREKANWRIDIAKFERTFHWNHRATRMLFVMIWFVAMFDRRRAHVYTLQCFWFLLKRVLYTWCSGLLRVWVFKNQTRTAFFSRLITLMCSGIYTRLLVWRGVCPRTLGLKSMLAQLRSHISCPIINNSMIWGYLSM